MRDRAPSPAWESIRVSGRVRQVAMIAIGLALVAVLAFSLAACGGRVSLTTATIKSAELAEDVDADYNPVGVTDRYSPDAPSFHCVVSVANAPEDTAVRAVWIAVDATSTPNYVIDEATIRVSGTRRVHFHLDRGEPPWPEGAYKVEIYLNGKLDRTLDFRVKAPVVLASPTPVPTDTPTPTATLTPEPTHTPKPTPRPVAKGKVSYAIWVEGWHYQVWIMNLDGTDKKMIVDYASEPSFSPDGKQIVYYDWRAGGFAIVNTDGTDKRVIYRDDIAAFPTWSPDGKTILFQAGDFVNWRFNIYAINADGSGYRLVVDGEQPAWSPDSSQIIYKGCVGGDCGIMIANADGSGKRRITMDPNDMNPSWSPDGRRIAFAGNRTGNWEIYVANVDGSGITQLTNHERTDAHPTWTADGRQIVFRSDREGTWAIWIMNADGTGLRKLTDASTSQRWLWEKISVSK